MKQLLSSRLGEPSRIQVEHLHIWITEARDKDTPNITNYLRLIELVQMEFIMMKDKMAMGRRCNNDNVNKVVILYWGNRLIILIAFILI